MAVEGIFRLAGGTAAIWRICAVSSEGKNPLSSGVCLTTCSIGLNWSGKAAMAASVVVPEERAMRTTEGTGGTK